MCGCLRDLMIGTKVIKSLIHAFTAGTFASVAAVAFADLTQDLASRTWHHRFKKKKKNADQLTADSNCPTKRRNNSRGQKSGKWSKTKYFLKIYEVQRYLSCHQMGFWMWHGPVLWVLRLKTLKTVLCVGFCHFSTTTHTVYLSS